MKIRLKRGKGWDAFAKAIDPNTFQRVLRRNMQVATTLNGKIVEAAIRRAIQGGDFEPNAALTVMIKGSSKPLVDHGEFFKAVTSVSVGPMEVFIGIVKTAEEYNLALALHEGVDIKVTPAMRGLFFYLWRASIGDMEPSKLTGRAAELWERAPGGWKPLKASTSVIHIPGRPFIDEVFEDESLKKTLADNWNAALRRTMQQLAKVK